MINDLPVEIRELIFNAIDTNLAFIQSTAVCKLWNAEIQSPWHKFAKTSSIIEEEEEGFWKMQQRDWKWIIKSKLNIFAANKENPEGKFVGRMTCINGIYTGELQGGNKNGFGTMKWTNGGFYMGYWKNNAKEQRGIQKWGIRTKWEGDTYDGDWKEGQRHGNGVYQWSNGDLYTGPWRGGLKHGQGFFLFGKSGNHYLGEYYYDIREGEGKFEWANGDSYEGSWCKGERHGRGSYKWVTGERYVGSWFRSHKEGKGKFIWENNSTYEGQWKAGKMHGKGQYTWPDGSSFSGVWENNCRVKGKFGGYKECKVKQEWSLHGCKCSTFCSIIDIRSFNDIPKFLRN